jgi:hypothetical protein
MNVKDMPKNEKREYKKKGKTPQTPDIPTLVPSNNPTTWDKFGSWIQGSFFLFLAKKILKFV